MPVLFLLRGPKMERHVAPINVKFGTGSGPPCQISRLSGRKCGNTAPKTVKNFEFWPEICTSGATPLHQFYEIHSVCTRLQVAFKFLVWSLSGDKQQSYKHFPAAGAFSHKFPIAPSGESTDQIKKS